MLIQRCWRSQAPLNFQHYFHYFDCYYRSYGMIAMYSINNAFDFWRWLGNPWMADSTADIHTIYPMSSWRINMVDSVFPDPRWHGWGWSPCTEPAVWTREAWKRSNRSRQKNGGWSILGKGWSLATGTKGVKTDFTQYINKPFPCRACAIQCTCLR